MVSGKSSKTIHENYTKELELGHPLRVVSSNFVERVRLLTLASASRQCLCWNFCIGILADIDLS